MSERWFDEWIEMAEQDFEAATSLDPEKTPHAVAFHCQQCIDKYLKAALVQHKLSVPGTHNLAELIGRLEREDPGFREIIGPACHLTVFAVNPRYPGRTWNRIWPRKRLRLCETSGETFGLCWLSTHSRAADGSATSPGRTRSGGRGGKNRHSPVTMESPARVGHVPSRDCRWVW